jgi:predicted acylesterase/phospholipase RssA
MFDSDEWLRKITWHTNDLTFEEAYQKTGTHAPHTRTARTAHTHTEHAPHTHRTGRILNITVTSRVKFGPPLLLNHLSTPHVTIASAVVASAAVPTFVHPVQLRERRDGREFPFGEVLARACRVVCSVCRVVRVRRVVSCRVVSANAVRAVRWR